LSLTFAICTYNRSADVRECLHHIVELGYAARYSVIVVDNSDDPKERAANEAAVHEIRGVRYLVSSPPGLSRARNVALEAAATEIVAFIDDDATVSAGWAEAVLAAFSKHGVICVGGPIVPRWEVPPPPWLQGKLLEALAVMDLGARDRDLTEREYFYGANVAFRLAALRAVGGFSEQLGRTGADLLGDEEIDVQRKLRAHGTLRYVAAARVHHRIHAERCSLEWFLRRYAWQGVSDARSGDQGVLNFLSTLLSPGSVPSSRAILEDLLGAEPPTPEEATERFLFARGLVGALLNAQVPLPKQLTTALRKPPSSIEDPEFASFRRVVPGSAQYLFLEFGVAHSALFDAYGSILGSVLLNPDLNPSLQQSDCIAFLQKALFYAQATGMKAVFLITADILMWSGYEGALEGPRKTPPLYGILHRLPADGASGRRLQAASRRAEGWCVFSDVLRDYLGDQYGIRNVVTIPHPPLFLGDADVPPDARHKANGRLGLAMLGEVRPGKGYEWVIETLTTAPTSLRSRFQVIMAGAADDGAPDRLQSLCAGAGIYHDLNLLSRSVRGYKAIPDSVFLRSLLASDIIVFPYEGDQMNAFSGHFADGLLAGCLFVATRGSVLGQLIEANDLGETFEVHDRASFYSALARAAQRIERHAVSSPARRRILNLYGATPSKLVVEDILRNGFARIPERADLAQPQVGPGAGRSGSEAS